MSGKVESAEDEVADKTNEITGKVVGDQKREDRVLAQSAASRLREGGADIKEETKHFVEAATDKVHGHTSDG